MLEEPEVAGVDLVHVVDDDQEAVAVGHAVESGGDLLEAGEPLDLRVDAGGTGEGVVTIQPCEDLAPGPERWRALLLGATPHRSPPRRRPPAR